jgi:hypothetical protein
LKKGDLGGFSRGYQIPPTPPLEKGGILDSFPMETNYTYELLRSLRSLRMTGAKIFASGSSLCIFQVEAKILTGRPESLPVSEKFSEDAIFILNFEP